MHLLSRGIILKEHHVCAFVCVHVYVHMLMLAGMSKVRGVCRGSKKSPEIAPNKETDDSLKTKEKTSLNK